MTAAEELVLRKRQLAAREGKHGYRVNCEMLRQRIAELEAEIG